VDRHYPSRQVKDIFVEKRMFPAGGVPEKTYLAYLKIEIRFRGAEVVVVEAGDREPCFA